MENIIIQISRYIITIMFAIYTLYCFTVFRSKNKVRQNRTFRYQRVFIFLLHLISTLILFLNAKSVKVLTLYAAQVVFLFMTIVLYQLFYKGLSKLVLNNMLMLLVISFIILERISYDFATRQFFMAAVIVVLSIWIPFVIEKMTFFDKLGWVYAFFGIVCLLLVFVVGIGVQQYGARNWIQIGRFQFQPSEFVKIIFVFFMASMLAKSTEFKRVVKITIVAASYVLILVAEKDLGAALIYFVTYLIVLFVASRNPLYLLSGLLGGSAAAVVAYKIFDHVQTRVTAWRDPWSVIDNQGYQITQSIFAIGTGGWFGMGLGKGVPETIPVVYSDFIFSAIAEELGGLFAVCLILVYISCFIMFVNISMKMKKNFYKLTALGLSVMYIFQVFLTIGGSIKFIPLTGVTLPLISYGGSSVVSTVLLFGVIQGMYVLNEKEGRIIEKKEKGNAKPGRNIKQNRSAE